MEKEKFDEFEKVAKPVSDFIRKNYDMHTTVIITETTAKVVRDDIGVPIIKAKEKYLTCELVNELKKQEAVSLMMVEPYKEIEIFIDGKKQDLKVEKGPVNILIIED